MSVFFYVLKKDKKEDIIPKTVKHIYVSYDYDDILQETPDDVNELTIRTTNKLFYDNIPNGIKIINIYLVILRDYNIILNNLPITLEKIVLSDYSGYSEFDYIEKNMSAPLYSIEQRKRKNMNNIIKNNIIKLPFGCVMTNFLGEQIVEFL